MEGRHAGRRLDRLAGRQGVRPPPLRPRPQELKTRLHPTVRSLGVVSLLTDASSEMIYPLLPAFLTGVLHAGPAFLGIVEGLAEATAAALKVISGRASDRTRRRKPLVVVGYALSSIVRPLVALATAPVHVLAVRVVDRVGKGVRGAPRDALVAQVTRPEDRGRAYGFTRALDHAGAMIGPLLATAALLLVHDLRVVFALAAVPGVLAVLMLVRGVSEEPRQEPADRAPRGPGGTRLEPDLVRYLVVVAIFTLGNSSDAFLLLRAQQGGIAVTLLPAVWALHHLVKAGASTWGGALSDRVGRRRTIVLGWSVYAAAYAGFALARSPWVITALFAFYGLFHAFSEGAERAIVAELAGNESRGRGFGLFHAVSGAALLPASLLTGFLWQRFGAPAAFAVGGTLAAIAAAGLLALVPERSRSYG